MVIVENRLGFLERDSMLLDVESGLGWIPLETERQNYSVTTNHEAGKPSNAGVRRVATLKLTTQASHHMTGLLVVTLESSYQELSEGSAIHQP